jgi:hypothetical protein
VHRAQGPMAVLQPCRGKVARAGCHNLGHTLRECAPLRECALAMCVKQGGSMYANCSPTAVIRYICGVHRVDCRPICLWRYIFPQTISPL